MQHFYLAFRILLILLDYSHKHHAVNGKLFFPFTAWCFLQNKVLFLFKSGIYGGYYNEKIPSFVFAIALLIACASVNLSDSSNNGALPHCDEPYAVTSQ